MRHARLFLTASAALLALAACEQPETDTDTETETAETEQAGMTQDPPAEGVARATPA